MRASTQHALLICLLSATMPPLAAFGDAIVVPKAMTASTIAEFFVDQQGIRVEIEVGARDLGAFRNVLPDGVYEKLRHEPRPAVDRIRHFFEQDWVIRCDDSAPLVGRVVRLVPKKRICRDEITGEALPVQPEDAQSVLLVELAYSWNDPPKTLSLQPPMGEDQRMPTANVGFILYHRGVPVNDFRYLGAESTVDLDWDDPWYSRFRNKNLRRQYDAPLLVFLYVESFEVRKEIIVRPKDLQHWIDLGLGGKETIPVEAQEALKQQVVEFLSERAQVVIDGQPVKGQLDRIHFVRRSLRTTGVVDPPEELDINTATLGVIFVYPIDGLPQRASVAWDLFSPRIQKIPAAATDEACGMPKTLSPEDPQLRWQNFLTNPTMPVMMAVSSPQSPTISIPVISGLCFGLAFLLLPVGLFRAKKDNGTSRRLLLAAAVTIVMGLLCLPYARASLTNPTSSGPTLDSQQAKEVLHALLYNVYRAFDHRDESLVYDRLALSIEGELLSDVYLQVRRSMELENQGGARVKVDDVTVLDVVQEGQLQRPGFAYRCRWTAAGSVGHWGHIHRRANQYDAVITVEPINSVKKITVWKITAIDLREEQRVDPNTPNRPAGTMP